MTVQEQDIEQLQDIIEAVESAGGQVERVDAEGGQAIRDATGKTRKVVPPRRATLEVTWE